MDCILKIFEDINKYYLVGIGEFSHGINESWIYRYELLKYVIKHTNKKITIFNEMSDWQSNNIMKNTYVDIKNDKIKKINGIKYEQPIFRNKLESPWGVLWQYCYHAMESPLFIKIIKYVRKYKDRITIIGVDNETLERDYIMYKRIVKNLKKAILISFGHIIHMSIQEN